MRQVFFFVALALVGFGLFLKLFYDVPDAQETVNFFTSWFFIIVGAAAALIVLFWSRRGKPE
ncbi:MAG: hypothetical protein NTX53_17120 [candidate division WOR-3 bacterium]|nr:hypothetical protein [candidate division WOR-3 bacterium]